MNIFHELIPASYNRTMDLFDIWLKKHDIDLSDRKVRSEVEDLMGEVLDAASLSENVRQELTDTTREELRDDVKSELRDEIESELREKIEAEYEEKKNEEDCDD